MPKSNYPVKLYRYDANSWQVIEGNVITEQPVNLTVNGEIWMTFMCTPTDLEALAVGFLFNEGVIESLQEVIDVRPCTHGENIDIWLNRTVERPDSWRRTSGCTGGVTAVTESFPAHSISDGHPIDPENVGNLIGKLFAVQELYRSAGGVHTSALSDGAKIILSAEDIGRHNTLDKLAGFLLYSIQDVSHRIILTTGRISSEMLQKSARMGASIVISRTSPSSISVELAERYGITLIGYAHRKRFIVYSHPERINSYQSNTVHMDFDL